MIKERLGQVAIGQLNEVTEVHGNQILVTMKMRPDP